MNNSIKLANAHTYPIGEWLMPWIVGGVRWQNVRNRHLYVFFVPLNNDNL